MPSLKYFDPVSQSYKYLVGQKSQDPLSGFRNVIRNGDLQIAQRGNGAFTATGYAMDGWFPEQSGGSFTLNRTVATNGIYSATFVVSGQALQSHYSGLWWPIENVNTLAGQTATLSFTASANIPRQVAVIMAQTFGSGGSAQINSAFGSPITLDTVSRRYSITGSILSTVGKTVGAGSTLWVAFEVSAGTSSSYGSVTGGIGTQNGTFTVTDVQLEEGSVATPFERLPIQQQLAWCQRYFYRLVQGSSSTRVGFGNASDANSWSGIIPLPVAMRAIPSMSTNSTFVMSDGANVPRTGVRPEPFGVTQQGGNPSTYAMQTLVGGGGSGAMGALQSYYFEWGGGSGGYIDFSAEL